MTLSTLRDLLIHDLKDLHSAEKQLVRALPKMAKAAKSEKLRAGFEEHLEQTRGHVERLEEALGLLNATPRGPKCAAMEGLISEGADLIEEKADEAVRDAALIGAAQKVEHYEIAGYGTAVTYAKQLGLDDVADLLSATLDEEKYTDAKLTELAESEINVEAEA